LRFAIRIGPAKALAQMLRLLYKLKVIDFDTLDRLIDRIQVMVWYGEHEDLESKDLAEHSLGPMDEEVLNQEL